MIAVWRAFLNSLSGVAHALRTERAIRQEAVLLLVAVPLALVVGTTPWVRLGLVLVLLFVLAVEFLNTSIEKLCDHVTPTTHPKIKAIKDMGSAACLCAQAGAGLVWLLALAERFGWI